MKCLVAEEANHTNFYCLGCVFPIRKYNLITNLNKLALFVK